MIRSNWAWGTTEHVGVKVNSHIHFSYIYVFKWPAKFIFVYGVRVCSNFDLNEAVQLSQYHLQQRLSLLHGIFLPPLLKINCP